MKPIKQLFKKLWVEGEDNITLATQYKDELKTLSDVQETTDKEPAGNSITTDTEHLVITYRIDEDFDAIITGIELSNQDTQLNHILSLCNLRKLAEVTEVSYDALRSYNSGRLKLSDKTKEKIIKAVKQHLYFD